VARGSTAIGLLDDQGGQGDGERQCRQRRPQGEPAELQTLQPAGAAEPQQQRHRPDHEASEDEQGPDREEDRPRPVLQGVDADRVPDLGVLGVQRP
jgi:hypothetical protein